ncbi:EAL domain-containing protein [Rhizobium sp. 18065]|uniref:bifunctional diguanylate cyclase/phosphodiesterase n=1 Tax=Rhizobium sp. 18065 TaxID=2681411 RepID=UPI0032AF4E7E
MKPKMLPLQLQNTILEMIATGLPVSETVDFLCREAEKTSPDIICSVLLLDDDNRVHHLAGPSLPKAYAAAIDGVQIGPGVGSCGTAAYTGKPVLVEDIETHPYWQNYKQLALVHGMLACWSTPMLVSGKVVGTFAFYYRTPRGPSPIERKLVDACVHLCAIAIERDQRIAERRRLAETDALTQLPNRARFNNVIQIQADSGRAWGLLLTDVDNLKMVNDTFGHQAGDDLISTVAERLARRAEPGMTFRLGGDEFAIIIPCLENQDPGTLAADLLAATKAPCECGGHLLYPSITIGGARADAGENPAPVRQNADYALYHAKERNRGRYIEYVPGLGTAIVKRFRAIHDVGEALRDDRIDAYYQPLVELSTGRIVGLEALCRMRTCNGEVIAAGHFQEAMKDAHVAIELTDRMLEKTAADCRRWMDAGLSFGRVGINLTAADFYRGGLTGRIGKAFEQLDVPLSKIVAEVTESVYLGQRDQIVADEIRTMRAAGLMVALDDFGTGFASLTHLLTVPVDIIKIDKCFVQRMVLDRAGGVIIKGLLDIADGLDILVVAEGIEDAEQAARLTAMGCRAGQGYLYARALDPDAALRLLHAGRGYITADHALLAEAAIAC